MKNIKNWNDLNEYGIICLTGEACNVSIRLLCDLTVCGQGVICSYLGLPSNTKFQPAWNNEGVGSVFLPYECFASLAGFCLMLDPVKYAYAVHIKYDGIYGIEHSDDPALVEQWLESNKANIVRYYRPIHAPHAGLSNVHAISGRAQ